MNVTSPKRTGIVSDQATAPEAQTPRIVAKASGLYVVRAMEEERLAPSSRRGASPSWIPGAWGDPF